MDNGGKWLLVVLGAIMALVLLFAGAVPLFQATIEHTQQSTIEDMLAYWLEQGYVAYADPDGTLHVYDVEPNDTCTYDLGSLSKYFRNIYINGELVTTGTVSGDLIPTDNDTYDLGSATHQWKDLYITDGSIYLGGRVLTDNGTQLKVDDTYISAPGTPDYVVGINTATDDVPGSTGYWVKSGSTGQVVETNASGTTSIQYALDTASGLGGHRLVALSGSPFAGTIGLNAPSNVDLDGNNAVINITNNAGVNGVQFTNTVNSIWENVNVFTIGTGAGTPSACQIQGASDSTLVIRHCSFTNAYTSSYAGEGGLGLSVFNTVASPIIEDTVGRGASAGNTVCNYGINLWLNVSGTTQLLRCTGIGDFGIAVTESNNATITDSIGIGKVAGFWLNDTSITLTRCKGIAITGNVGGAIGGFRLFCGGRPTLIDCEGISAPGDASAGFSITDESAAQLLNCYGHPPTLEYRWEYDVANNGQFRPFAGYAYQVIGLSIWVQIASSGKTLDLGTTIGGHEIAQSIPLDIVGNVRLPFTKELVATNGYIYATPSGAIPQSSVFIYTDVMYSSAGNTGLYINTSGNAQIIGGTYLGVKSDGKDMALLVGDNAISYPNWRINNAHLESFGEYAVYLNSALSDVPIYNCQFWAKVPTYNVTNLAGGGSIINQMRQSIANILGFGDVKGLWSFSELTGTSVSDYSKNGHTATASLTLASWTTRPAISSKLPIYTFGGTAYLSVLDSTDFSFGDNTTDEAFSIVMLINDTVGAGNIALISKDDLGGQREWIVTLQTNFLRLYLHDTVHDKNVNAYTGVIGNNARHIVIITYDGGGGATAANGINFYVDGLLVSKTAENDAQYVAMSDTTSKLCIGATDGGAIIFTGEMAMPFIIQKQLTANEAWQITQLYKYLLGQ